MSDILVIGGGIIGLLTARELVQAGAEVTLVEMGETGRESSWAGGGIVSPLYPWRYADAVTRPGALEPAGLPRSSAPQLHDETGIDPELTPNGLLILDTEERDQALAWAERHAVRDPGPGRRAGPCAVEPELGPRPAQALLLPDVAQVRNPRLVKAARRALDGRIATARAGGGPGASGRAGGRARGVRTAQGRSAADQVVVCTGAWTARLLEQLGARPDIEPVRGQMILFLARPGQINHITLYRDRYVIPRRDGRVLFGSTLEHTGFVKATTAEAKEALYRSAVELFPLLKRTPIEDHWSGLRPGSPSGIPYIGAYPGIAGLYFNAGHFRNGVVTGPASARLVADLMLGREPILDPAPYALDASR